MQLIVGSSRYYGFSSTRTITFTITAAFYATLRNMTLHFLMCSKMNLCKNKILCNDKTLHQQSVTPTTTAKLEMQSKWQLSAVIGCGFRRSAMESYSLQLDRVDVPRLFRAKRIVHVLQRHRAARLHALVELPVTATTSARARSTSASTAIFALLLTLFFRHISQDKFTSSLTNPKQYWQIYPKLIQNSAILYQTFIFVASSTL